MSGSHPIYHANPFTTGANGSSSVGFLCDTVPDFVNVQYLPRGASPGPLFGIVSNTRTTGEQANFYPMTEDQYLSQPRPIFTSNHLPRDVSLAKDIQNWEV